MKKMIAIFSGLIATTSLINQSIFTYTVNDKTKNFNIITTDIINENEVKNIIIRYFNNIEGVIQIKELDINEIKQKTQMIVIWLLIANLIDEEEKVKTILTTKMETHTADAIFKSLFTSFMLSVSNEKHLKLLAIMWFFIDKEFGGYFELIFKDEDNNKSSLTIKKKALENFNQTAFNAFKYLVKININKINMEEVFDKDNTLDTNEKNIMKEKLKNIIDLLASFSFEDLKVIYDEIQIEDNTTFIIDFTDLIT